MNLNQFPQKSVEAVQAAQQMASARQNQQIEQAHLLAALLRQDGGLVPQLLKKMGVTVESLDAAVGKELEKLPRVTGSGREADKFYVSRAVDTALNQAEKIAADALRRCCESNARLSRRILSRISFFTMFQVFYPTISTRFALLLHKQYLSLWHL